VKGANLGVMSKEEWSYPEEHLSGETIVLVVVKVIVVFLVTNGILCISSSSSSSGTYYCCCCCYYLVYLPVVIEVLSLNTSLSIRQVV